MVAILLFYSRPFVKALFVESIPACVVSKRIVVYLENYDADLAVRVVDARAVS
jgi:hypothetical protein